MVVTLNVQGFTLASVVRRALIDKEAAELQHLYDDHHISDTTRRRLQRSLDLEEARLSDH